MRKICYISGTRADYGLMRLVLQKLHACADIKLSICVTGMHLSDLYGHTINEILADGFQICAEIPVEVDKTSHASMAKGIGYQIIAMTELFERDKPDIVLLLGDRGESLAAAVAAVHLNIPVVHLHGGERSGTVDEMVRHAISKLAHYHFTATEAARMRLVQMGEKEESIYVVGAPGLDEIATHSPCSREVLCQKFGFDPHKPLALLIFHPVVQESATIALQMENVLLAALELGLQVVVLEPNSDAGGAEIRKTLLRYEANPQLCILKHLPRNNYLDTLANVDLLVGNSSSGIIEAASFHLNVVNVGSRQNLRERGDNVFDSGTAAEEIKAKLQLALAKKGTKYSNIYGDGKTSARCCHLLQTLSLDTAILNKSNVY